MERGMLGGEVSSGAQIENYKTNRSDILSSVFHISFSGCQLPFKNKIPY
jgi:hypothetical protein